MGHVHIYLILDIEHNRLWKSSYNAVIVHTYRQSKQLRSTTVTEERSYYRSVCKISSDDLKRTFTTNSTFQVPPPAAMILPLSHNIICHYSFDMAQQVNNKNFSSFIIMML